jgi:hypothetical protein
VTKNKSLIRKVAYIAAIAILLIPLSRLSEPATLTQTKDENGQAEPWPACARKVASLRPNWAKSTPPVRR